MRTNGLMSKAAQACDHAGEPILTPTKFSNGSDHTKASCGTCGKFIRWMPRCKSSSFRAKCFYLIKELAEAPSEQYELILLQARARELMLCAGDKGFS